MSAFRSRISGLPDEKLLQAFISQKAIAQLIAERSGMYEAIMHVTEGELLAMKYVGRQSAWRIQCLREIFHRLQEERRAAVKRIRTPQDIAAYFMDMQHLQQEQFRVLLLNCKNGILAEKLITQGTIDASIVSPREIFSAAVKHLAKSVVLVHNHPSGDPTPSKEDIGVTDNLMQAGKILNVIVLDHVIIGKGKFYSFREEGAMPHDI